MLSISAKSSTEINFTANYGGFYFFVIEILRRIRGEAIDLGGSTVECIDLCLINTTVHLNSCGYYSGV